MSFRISCGRSAVILAVLFLPLLLESGGARAGDSKARVCATTGTVPVSVSISKLGRRSYKDAQCAYHAAGFVEVTLSVKSHGAGGKFLRSVSVSLPLKAAHTYTLGVKERFWDDKGKQRSSYDVVVESVEPLGSAASSGDDSEH